MKHPEQANPENNDRFKLTISDLNAPTKVHDDLHNDLGEFSEAQGDDEYLIQFNAIGYLYLDRNCEPSFSTFAK